jgi:hypothetical protein
VIPSNRGRQERPTHRELSGKIQQCRALAAANKWLPAEPGKLKANFDEMEELFGIDTYLPEDQAKILQQALSEIAPEHYAGSRPPQQSYEPTIQGKELFAFRWTSTCFGGREMYFKFCVSGKGDDKRAFICSIHPNRPSENE